MCGGWVFSVEESYRRTVHEHVDVLQLCVEAGHEPSHGPNRGQITLMDLLMQQPQRGLVRKRVAKLKEKDAALLATFDPIEPTERHPRTSIWEAGKLD